MDVLKACEKLTPLQKRRLSKELGWNYDELPLTCSPGSALNIWATDALMTLPLADQEQVWLIADVFGSQINKFGQILWSSLEGRMDRTELAGAKLPVSYVGLADRAYVSITGESEMLNLRDAKKIPGTKFQFFETIQHNLTTLFMRRFLALRYKAPDTEATDASSDEG